MEPGSVTFLLRLWRSCDCQPTYTEKQEAIMEQYDEVARGAHSFACFRQGTGERLILAHCSGGSHRQWQSLAEAASDRYEVIAPDFLGYGKSSRFSSWGAGDNPDLGLLMELLDECREPAHLIGHSYGGALALRAALQLPHRVRSLTLYEPVVFNLLRDHGYDGPWATISKTADRIIHLVSRGQYEGAAKTFVHYWENQWAWMLMPSWMKQKLAKAMPKIAAEFAEMYGPSPTEQSFLNLIMPVHLIRGGRTKPETEALLDVLSRLIPSASVTVIPRLGHLGPVTKPEKVNRHVLGWLESQSHLGLGITEYLELARRSA